MLNQKFDQFSTRLSSAELYLHLLAIKHVLTNHRHLTSTAPATCSQPLRQDISQCRHKIALDPAIYAQSMNESTELERVPWMTPWSAGTFPDVLPAVNEPAKSSNCKWARSFSSSRNRSSRCLKVMCVHGELLIKLAKHFLVLKWVRYQTEVCMATAQAAVSCVSEGQCVSACQQNDATCTGVYAATWSFICCATCADNIEVPSQLSWLLRCKQVWRLAKADWSVLQLAWTSDNLLQTFKWCFCRPERTGIIPEQPCPSKRMMAEPPEDTYDSQELNLT